MNFNQFGMTNSIVSEVEYVYVRIMSILHNHIIRRNYIVYVLIPMRRNHTLQNGCEEVMESLQPLDNGFVMQS